MSSIESATVVKPKSAGVRLSVMMFLQYAVWGVWLPYLANYLGAPRDAGGLGFSGSQIGWILGLAGSVGAIAGPFVAGQLADRVMNAERAIALLLIIGGCLKITNAFVTDFHTFLVIAVLYSAAYMPTLALSNSIAFANLDDPQKKFPPVRAVGTIGWMAASNIFPLVWLTASTPAENTARVADALIVSGSLAIIYAVYALFALPKTPPKRDASKKLAFAEAFGLLRLRAFYVVALAALAISMIHQCYFIRTGPFLVDAVGFDLKWVGPIMSIGQASEIFFLAILGFFIKRIGFKGVLLIGAASYAARYALFSLTGPQELIIGAMLLHGMNYGCFFAGAFLLVESLASPDIRHSAQTVFGITILGIGPVLGGAYNMMFDPPPGEPVDYARFWQTQAMVAAAVFFVLLLAFPRISAKKEIA